MKRTRLLQIIKEEVANSLRGKTNPTPSLNGYLHDLNRIKNLELYSKLDEYIDIFQKLIKDKSVSRLLSKGESPKLQSINFGPFGAPQVTQDPSELQSQLNNLKKLKKNPKIQTQKEKINQFLDKSIDGLISKLEKVRK